MEGEFLSREERMKQADEFIRNKIEFKHKIWILGCGSVGTNMLYMLCKKISNIEIEMFDGDQTLVNGTNIIERRVNHIRKVTGAEIKLTQEFLTEKNYKKLLQVKKDDIIVDCSFNVCTISLFDLCYETGCSYVNSSIEIWENNITTPHKNTLKWFHDKLDKANHKKTPTNNFIVCHGMNPGVVSYMAKVGILKVMHAKKKKIPENASYAELAQEIGLQTIHISEKDTQIGIKEHGQYYNTWASKAVSMYDEAESNVEFSWGTHEDETNQKLNKIIDYPKSWADERYMVLKERGMSLYGMSYVPHSKMYIGMIMQHYENLTIGNKLTIKKDGKIVYKPSVYYVYHPSDNTLMSFYEYKENNLEKQEITNLMTDDIVKGEDELGLSLFLDDGTIYWIGSLIDIKEARELFYNEMDPFVNATTVPVAASYMAAFMFLVRGIEKQDYKGFIAADDMPCHDVFKDLLPFMGPFVFMQVPKDDENWRCDKYVKRFEGGKDEGNMDLCKKKWIFTDFVVEF